MEWADVYVNVACSMGIIRLNPSRNRGIICKPCSKRRVAKVQEKENCN